MSKRPSFVFSRFFAVKRQAQEEAVNRKFANHNLSMHLDQGVKK